MILKQWYAALVIICLVVTVGLYDLDHRSLSLSPELARLVGLQIWKNECGGTQEGLTSWNEGEEFASLGIGHFIWYPENKEKIFKETFPDLLAFFKSHGVRLPDWLNQAKGCPWQTREEFQQAHRGETLQELRRLLVKYVDVQILFMVQRLQKALSTLLKHADQSEHSHLIFQFYRLGHTPDGLYALLDYLNFKGEGTAFQERYQGQGWGLLQVLAQLRGTEPGMAAVKEFVETAKQVLALRVEKAPSERQETRWLQGWYNRLETYNHFSQKTHNAVDE
jgi:hypothetical protein